MLCLFSNLKGFDLITFNSPIFFRSIRLLFRFFPDFFGLFRFLDLLVSHGSEVFAIFFRFFSEVFGHRFFFQSEVFANTSRSDHRSLNPNPNVSLRQKHRFRSHPNRGRLQYRIRRRLGGEVPNYLQVILETEVRCLWDIKTLEAYFNALLKSFRDSCSIVSNRECSTVNHR